jgi:hypothetical protein
MMPTFTFGDEVGAPEQESTTMTCPLKVQAVDVFNHIPDPALGGFWTAPRIHNPVERKVRGLSFPESSAARHPAAVGITTR